MPDVEISNGSKPKAKFDLDPLEWCIISVTVIITTFLIKYF